MVGASSCRAAYNILHRPDIKYTLHHTFFLWFRTGEGRGWGEKENAAAPLVQTPPAENSILLHVESLRDYRRKVGTVVPITNGLCLFVSLVWREGHWRGATRRQR